MVKTTTEKIAMFKFILKEIDISFGSKKGLLKRCTNILRQEGVTAVINKSRRWLNLHYIKYRLYPTRKSNIPVYQRWIDWKEPSPVECDKIKLLSNDLKNIPLLQIVIRSANPTVSALMRTIKSIESQYINKWSIHIILNRLSPQDYSARAEELAQSDDRIKVVFDNSDGYDIRAYINNQPDDVYVAWISPGDTLAPWAFTSVAFTLSLMPNIALLYSDSDHLDSNFERTDPNFVTDWAPETFLSNFYDLGLGFVKVREFKNTKALDFVTIEFQPAAIFALFKVLDGKDVGHIPQVLIHYQNRIKPDDQTVMELIQRSMAIQGIAMKIGPTKFSGVYRVDYEISHTPLVSIVIPTAGKKNSSGKWWILQCVEDIKNKSTWKNLEIVVMDNNDIPGELRDQLLKLEVELISYTKSFFNLSEKINHGVRHSSGEIVVVMNDDMTINSPGWIEAMLNKAMHPDIGAVGALLIYPDKRVQHAGVALLPIGPIHVNVGIPYTEQGYFNYHIGDHNALIVTGACIMFRRETFDLVGGWNENFPLDFNDVDYCLKITKLGLRIVVASEAIVTHYESSSREMGENELSRALAETSRFMKNWDNVFFSDPYFSPNFTHPSPISIDLDNAYQIHMANFNHLAINELSRAAHIESAPTGLFSFVTTVYNTPVDLLSSMAESLLDQIQDYPFEWVVLDNGTTSTDTKDWMDRNLSHHPKVRFLHTADNLGIVGGMEVCLKNSTGRYIVPLDSDDIVFKGAVSKLVESVIVKNFPEVLYTDELVIDECGQPFLYYYKPTWDSVLNAACCINVHITLFDRAIALKLGVYSDSRATGCHDWDTVFRFVEEGFTPVHIPFISYGWRQHDQSCAKNMDSKDYINSSQSFVLQRFVDSRLGANEYEVKPRKGSRHLVQWEYVKLSPSSRKKNLVIVMKEKNKSNESFFIEHFFKRNQLKKSDFSNIVIIEHEVNFASFSTIRKVINAFPEDSLTYFLDDSLYSISEKWLSDPEVIMDIFDDTVCVGGTVFNSENIVYEAGQFYSLGCGADNPLRNSYYRAATLWDVFINNWRTVNCCAFASSVYNNGFLCDFIENGEHPEDTPLTKLGLWLGLHCSKKGLRVVHSPFMTASSIVPLMDYRDDKHWKKFRETAWDYMQENKLLHPLMTTRNGYGLEAIEPNAFVPYQRFY